MSDYVVTGANGFIGSHLVREILKRLEHRVIALVRPSAPLWRLQGITTNLIIKEVEFEQQQSILDALKEYSPMAIFHLAWEGVTNTYRNDPIQYGNLNILKNLLEVARQLSIKTFIGLGSQAEYGIKNYPIKEEEPLNPVTLYGKEKVKAYEYTRAFCEQHYINYVWMRLFSAYGPMDNPTWLIPYVINELLHDREPLLTQGTQVWDYLYVEDVARAIFLAESFYIGGVFNLGSGSPITIKEVVQSIYKLLNKEQKIPFGTVPFREDHNRYLQADMTKFLSKCTWVPATSLEEGIVKTVAYDENS